MERRRLFSGEPDREVRDELEFHLEQRVAEFMAKGLDPESARRAALDKMGDYDRVRGECTDLLTAERRSHARRDWFSDLRQDVRFAVRAAARGPLFTMLAVLTLALGIGANSAVFGVVKSVLLNALPYGEARRLVRVESRFETAPDAGTALAAGTIHDVIERQRSFSGLGGSVSNGPDAILQSDAGAANVRLAWVQPGYFGVLGVSPAQGREFEATDAGDTARVVMLSYEVWRERFGGADDVLGSTIVLNGLPRTVVGVLPRGFIHPIRATDFFLPLHLQALLRDPVSARGSHFMELVGRLRDGVTIEAARADVSAIGEDLAREHPWDYKGLTLSTTPLHETMVGDTRTPLLVLMASAALVLLIACANLAGALLSRTIARRREFSVRISLGAGRGRLVRQLLAESVLLALVGGLLGLVLAHAGLATLRAADLDAIPDYARLTLDTGAVLFTLAVALLTGAAFGITPALSVARAEPQAILRDESRGGTETRGTGKLRGVLVAAQVALCLSLLTGAGLLTRSLWLMATEPLGFDSSDALTFRVSLPANRYGTVAGRNAYMDELSERLAALPGVEAVTAMNFLPTRVGNSNGTTVVGAARDPNDPVPFILTHGVGENFFDVMNIPLIRGRTFHRGDAPGAPLVAIVSESAARKFWGDRNPVGERIRMGPDPESTPLEVVGVVRDVRTSLTAAEPEPMIYRPVRQSWLTTFVVRTRGNPLTHANDVRRVVMDYDRAVPIADFAPLRELIDEGLAARRLPMMLMLAFGTLALLLACIGIYALFANMALAREREFGVRMALGSSRAAVARLVLRQGALWMAVGLMGGALGMYVVSRALRTMIYGIAPLDPVSIAAAIAALVLAAGIALALPVHRATRSDPLSIIR